MRLIDANKLMLWLNDVWYSSFKYEESPTSIAVKEAMKAITEYVNTQTDVEPSGDLISREEVLRAIITAGEAEPDLGYTHLHKVIESLPSATCDDCIWHVCNYNKIDWDGEDGYIS